LPRAGGDGEDGSVVVFHFAGSGGTIEGNIRRWRDLFSTASGDPLPQGAGRVGKFTAHGMNVTLVGLCGRHTEAPMMSSKPSEPKDNYRLLEAIVETPNGPWFFRAIGPAATMAAHEPEFKKLIASVRQ